MAGGGLQLPGHLRDHRQRQVELGDAAGDVELGEDRAGPGIGVLSRQRPEHGALVALEVAEQGGGAGEQVQALVVQPCGHRLIHRVSRLEAKVKFWRESATTVRSRSSVHDS